MAKTQMTIVFCYDVDSNRTRRKLAACLEEQLVRVQESVFEGRLTLTRAGALFDRAAALLDDGDKLRMYVLSHDGVEKCRVHGGVPLPEDGGFILV